MMIRLLFILYLTIQCLLCSSQTKWTVISDSIQFYKIDDSGAEFILENDTRSITGFLKNVGNGRTEFENLKIYSIGDTCFTLEGSLDTFCIASFAFKDSTRIIECVTTKKILYPNVDTPSFAEPGFWYYYNYHPPAVTVYLVDDNYIASWSTVKVLDILKVNDTTDLIAIATTTLNDSTFSTIEKIESNTTDCSDTLVLPSVSCLIVDDSLYSIIDTCTGDTVKLGFSIGIDSNLYRTDGSLDLDDDSIRTVSGNNIMSLSIEDIENFTVESTNSTIKADSGVVLIEANNLQTPTHGVVIDSRQLYISGVPAYSGYSGIDTARVGWTLGVIDNYGDTYSDGVRVGFIPPEEEEALVNRNLSVELEVSKYQYGQNGWNLNDRNITVPKDYVGVNVSFSIHGYAANDTFLCQIYESIMWSDINTMGYSHDYRSNVISQENGSTSQFEDVVSNSESLSRIYRVFVSDTISTDTLLFSIVYDTFGSYSITTGFYKEVLVSMVYLDGITNPISDTILVDIVTPIASVGTTDSSLWVVQNGALTPLDTNRFVVTHESERFVINDTIDYCGSRIPFTGLVVSDTFLLGSFGGGTFFCGFVDCSRYQLSGMIIEGATGDIIMTSYEENKNTSAKIEVTQDGHVWITGRNRDFSNTSHIYVDTNNIRIISDNISLQHHSYGVGKVLTDTSGAGDAVWSYNSKSVSVSAQNYTVQEKDKFVLYDTISATVDTVYLLDTVPYNGWSVNIIDGSGTAFSKNIVVRTTGGLFKINNTDEVFINSDFGALSIVGIENKYYIY